MNGATTPNSSLGSIGQSLNVPRKQLTISQADNGYLLSDFSYNGISKVATDFDSAVAILKEFFGV